MGALVCYVDRDVEGCKACPSLLFDRNITGGRGMVCSVLTLAVGSNQGMGGVESARSATSTSLWSSCADRWPALQHHGQGERGRLLRR
jgi:hypothetical protein